MESEYRGRDLSGRPPDAIPLTAMQAQRLAATAGVEAKRLEGRTLTELTDELRWAIEPHILGFRRVCGRVVKRNPVTGRDEGVPFATVHVEDTDVSFFGYFPGGWPYVWLLPFLIRREEIASVRTDACGNFCVWIPRFEIDWILRFRWERRCYGDLFRRPTVRDLLERLQAVDLTHRLHHDPPLPVDPNPPDPAPDLVDVERLFPELTAQLVGRDVAQRLDLALGTGAVGESLTERSRLLDRPAFPDPVPPPLPAGGKAVPDADLKRRLPAALADHAEQVDDLRPERFAGPFLRCRDVLVPEWAPILDVPDVTFRVTQDVDGDGDEETIYSEGFFDVRWDAGPIPPVTLHASSIAISSPFCDGPVIGETDPGIYVVGKMPLVNPPSPPNTPYVDETTGYAVRPNRPHPSGRADELPAAASRSTAPLAGLLDLFGYALESGGTPATHYRILRRTSVDGGASWSPPVPIADTWQQYRFDGAFHYVTLAPINADGWYERLDPALNWLPGGANWLLSWHGPPDGFHELSLELGVLAGGGVTTLPASPDPRRIRVDNAYPHAAYTTLAYRELPSGSWIPLPLTCPVIHRAGHPVELRVTFQAWATHLRSVDIVGSGCGGGTPALTAGFEPFQTGVPMGAVTSGYWHKGPADNAFANGPGTEVRFRIDAGLPAGAYSIRVRAHSRAFSPADGHVFDPLNPDVTYDPTTGLYADAYLPIAVVD